MKRLLVIEDGTEYEEFARLFLGRDFEVCAAHSAAEALSLVAAAVHALLIDLRFDRAPAAALVGDVAATAERLFAGDRERALRHLQDNQGVLILAALRQAGHTQRAVFVHEFAERRLENLRRLYGDIHAVTNFDAGALRRVLDAGR
jgi:ActR/RegA family two-component response regulator